MFLWRSEGHLLHVFSLRNVLRLIEYLMFLSFSNCLQWDAPLPSLFPSFLIYMLCLCVFVGVCSAWAVGGVVVMESVLCDLWAGLQDANQEVCERRRGPGLWTARDSDQTLQHSSVSWLVPSPYTWYTQSLSLGLSAYSSMAVFFPFFFFQMTKLTFSTLEFTCICIYILCSSITALVVTKCLSPLANNVGRCCIHVSSHRWCGTVDQLCWNKLIFSASILKNIG